MSKNKMQKTIVMDPPWNEKGGGKIKRGADKHYSTMKKTDILDVIKNKSPWNPDPSGCSVWIWATVNHLPDALWLMDNLGATYVTNAVWVKADIVTTVTTKGERKAAIVPAAAGLGQRLRICHELLLFGRIGKVPVPAPADRMPSTIYAPRGRHSEKPSEAFRMIYRHDGHQNKEIEKLEIFARRPRDGWQVWGAEANG